MKIFLIFIFLPVLAFAQSEFINNNHLGLCANFGYVTNKILSGSGGSVGLSVNGMFDIDAEFVNSEIENGLYNNNYKTSSTLFYLAYNFKRKDSFSNVKVLIGYLTTTLDQKYYSSQSSSGPALGLSISFRAVENENTLLMPALNILYGFLSVGGKGSNYGYYSSSDDSYLQNTRSISFDLNLELKASENINFIVTPSISKDLISKNNSISYSIIGGILIDIDLESK